jgi:site-specific recombinase XerD
MDQEMRDFAGYLSDGKGRSPHTVAAYTRDLKEFRRFLAQKRQVDSWDQVQAIDVRAFMAQGLKRLAKSTVARKLASLRAFFDFLRGARPQGGPLPFGSAAQAGKTSAPAPERGRGVSPG